MTTSNLNPDLIDSMKTALLSTLLLGLAACGSVRYGDSKGTETVNVDWGSTDLQTFSAAMVDSLVGAQSLAYLDHSGKGADKRVVLYLGSIENKTDQHIDTGGLRDMMQDSLLQSGKFRIVANTQGQGEIEDQVRFQQGSGRVLTEQAKAFGKQLGADVVLYGTLRDITKEKGRSLESAGVKTKDVYFQLSLTCVNIETGELLWSRSEDIRKTQRWGIFS